MEYCGEVISTKMAQERFIEYDRTGRNYMMAIREFVYVKNGDCKEIY
jgi:hypothetical protein